MKAKLLKTLHENNFIKFIFDDELNEMAKNKGVYILFKIDYVGMSTSGIAKRINNGHQKKSVMHEVVGFIAMDESSDDSIRDIEYRLINTYHPPLNIIGNNNA